jgi:hypothetical protein
MGAQAAWCDWVKKKNLKKLAFDDSLVYIGFVIKTKRIHVKHCICTIKIYHNDLLAQ